MSWNKIDYYIDLVYVIIIDTGILCNNYLKFNYNTMLAVHQSINKMEQNRNMSAIRVFSIKICWPCNIAAYKLKYLV